MPALPHLPRPRPAVAWWLGAAATVVALVVIVPAVDAAALGGAARRAAADPLRSGAALTLYAAAFVLRAAAWRRVLPRLTRGHAWAGIHVALGGNHLLPLRLGEALRVTSVVRRQGVAVADAVASTVTLRAGDVAAVVLLAVVTGPVVVADLTGGWGWLLLPAAAAVAGVGIVWLRRREGTGQVRPPGLAVLAFTVVAWLLEAAVVLEAARWVGVELGVADAVLVTSVTVAAQTFAVAPGGFGTYEAAATATLVALGVDPGRALALALAAHAVKTLYALVAGAVATVVPAPGLLGRLRLGRAGGRGPATVRSAATVPVPVADDAPVALFMPAYDEAACIASVVARVPARAAGRRVEFFVVDDGSTDDTVARARAAGAEVVELGANHGLGAAVRRGLAEGVARGAAAVAFCDADGEYAPEELDRLLDPLLAGTADYVVGSRFSGDIERMLPHRRLGNRVLTGWVRFLARRPVTDGQSGYRALSAGAAAAAEVIHDFNYAQVLTLDLLAKGYRYTEVPISYRFRETGDSFVTLGRYLRAVLPAVWRELNDRGGTGPAPAGQRSPAVSR
jgi:uncharacterized membrane protein YbhN (UPF0104 family)